MKECRSVTGGDDCVSIVSAGGYVAAPSFVRTGCPGASLQVPGKCEAAPAFRLEARLLYGDANTCERKQGATLESVG
jgi:hypothetical protein